MHALIRRFALVSVLLSVLVLAGGLSYGPSGGVDALGFQDDTHEPCLGPSDPSPHCSSGGGSSGSGVSCYSCSWEYDPEGALKKVSCQLDNDNGGGESCTAHMSGGEGFCSIPRSPSCE